MCISCGRHPQYVQCLNDLCANPLWYPWWSILFLHDAGALAHYDYAEVSVLSWMYSFLHLKGFSAGLRQLGNCDHFHRTICCRMVRSKRILVSEANVWLKHLNWLLTSDTFITDRDDVVPYWGTWCSVIRDLIEHQVLCQENTDCFSAVNKVMDLYCCDCLYCPLPSMGHVFGH